VEGQAGDIGPVILIRVIDSDKVKALGAQGLFPERGIEPAGSHVEAAKASSYRAPSWVRGGDANT
jgi:hypothetical protein